MDRMALCSEKINRTNVAERGSDLIELWEEKMRTTFNPS